MSYARIYAPEGHPLAGQEFAVLRLYMQLVLQDCPGGTLMDSPVDDQRRFRMENLRWTAEHDHDRLDLDAHPPARDALSAIAQLAREYARTGADPRDAFMGLYALLDIEVHKYYPEE